MTDIWEDPVNEATATVAHRPDTQDEVVFREVWAQNVYRLRRKDIEGRVVVDIGANVGAFSIWAAKLGAQFVHAYEPEPGNLAALERNLILSDVRHSVTPHGVAVGGRSGIGGLIAPRDPTETGGWSTTTDAADGGTDVVFTALRDVIDLASAHDAPLLMKVDIEGGEYALTEAIVRDAFDPVERFVAEFHAASHSAFGWLVARLAEWGHVETLGRPSVGGMIYARRFGVEP